MRLRKLLQAVLQAFQADFQPVRVRHLRRCDTVHKSIAELQLVAANPIAVRQNLEVRETAGPGVQLLSGIPFIDPLQKPEIRFLENFLSDRPIQHQRKNVRMQQTLVPNELSQELLSASIVCLLLIPLDSDGSCTSVAIPHVLKPVIESRGW